MKPPFKSQRMKIPSLNAKYVAVYKSFAYLNYMYLPTHPAPLEKFVL